MKSWQKKVGKTLPPWLNITKMKYYLMMFKPGVVNGRIIAFVTWKSYLVMHGSYMLLYMTGYLNRDRHSDRYQINVDWIPR